MKEKTIKMVVVVRVCYWPLRQDDDTKELFFKELRDISRSSVLVLMDYFKRHQIGQRQSRCIWCLLCLCLQHQWPQCRVLEDCDWKDDKLTANSELVQDLLLQLHAHKSLRPGGISPRVLKELLDVASGLLSIIFQLPWEFGEISASWKLANVVSIFKKGKKEDPVIIILSAPLQCLVKLWRLLFWERQLSH